MTINFGPPGLNFRLLLVWTRGLTEEGVHVLLCLPVRGRDRCLEEARLAEFTVEECRLCKRTDECTQTYVLPHLRNAGTRACESRRRR